MGNILKNSDGQILLLNGQPLYNSWAIPTPGPAYPTTNLVARYDFDNNLDDSFGSNNSLTTNSGTASWSYVTGLVDNAIASGAPGTTDATKSLKNSVDADVYGLTDGTNEFTWAIWIKSDTCTALQRVISWESTDWNTICYMSSGGYINYRVRQTFPGSDLTTFLSTGTYDDNGWHLIMGIYDGTTDYLYVDNTLIDSNTRGSVDARSNMQVNGGITGNGLGDSIDQLYLYNKALDATERSTLYNSGSGV